MSISKLSFLLVVSVFVSGVFCVDGEDLAVSAVLDAEVAVASAYDAVLDAEVAGADVSGLLDRLSVAGGYLAEAEVWLGLGDFDEAVRLAGLCIDAVDGVSDEAFGLESEAHALWASDVVVRMVGSMVGVVVVVFLGFVVWRLFRRRYNRRVLGLKPEVVSRES